MAKDGTLGVILAILSIPIAVAIGYYTDMNPGWAFILGIAYRSILCDVEGE